VLMAAPKKGIVSSQAENCPQLYLPSKVPQRARTIFDIWPKVASIKRKMATITRPLRCLSDHAVA